MLTAEQILENYNKHIAIITSIITGDRRDQVLSMIETIGETYVMSLLVENPGTTMLLPVVTLIMSIELLRLR